MVSAGPLFTQISVIFVLSARREPNPSALLASPRGANSPTFRRWLHLLFASPMLRCRYRRLVILAGRARATRGTDSRTSWHFRARQTGGRCAADGLFSRRQT